MNRCWIPGLLLLILLMVVGCVSAMQAATPADDAATVQGASVTVVASAAKTLEPTAMPSVPAEVSKGTEEDPATVADVTADAEAPEETASLVADPTPLPEPVLPEGVISGTIMDGDGPVSGATVRVQLTEYATISDDDGTFALTNLPMTDPVIVTAWADGYYIGQTEALAGLVPVTITMKPYYLTDNLDYDWFEFNGVRGSASCEPCHPSYAEWRGDAHSQSAINPRFISMYEGTDVDGNRSPNTVFGTDGMIVPPDPDTYYGPGVKTDYPDRNWNCAACHVPMASKLDPSDTCGWSGCHREITAERMDQISQAVDATHLEDVNALDGIGCDFCHKIGDVYLKPETGLPYPDRPGISSLRLFRPEEGEQLFFGITDDDPRRVSKLPLLEESAYCAGCHYGVFAGVVEFDNVEGGVVIYNSFGEWLDSPYSDPETGKTCQDCHMPVSDRDYFVYPEQGGLIRENLDIHNHDMPGITDEEFMQGSLTMTTSAAVVGDRVTVEINITNDNTGHHVPTGAPQRHMILVVSAVDEEGNVLSQVTGSVLPKWAGNYAGLPGEAYAKVLRDEWSGETPSAAYWRDVTLVSDNRIGAYETATSGYAFNLEGDGEVTIEATLWYRRAFQYLAELKGWDDPDLMMATNRVQVTP